MWIMTSFGILMPATRPAETIEPGDDRLLQVRARDRRALNHLRRFMGDELGPVIATPTLDYEFRAYCTHEAFALALAELIREIDYPRFKPTAVSDELHHVYVAVWDVIQRLGGGRRDNGHRVRMKQARAR